MVTKNLNTPYLTLILLVTSKKPLKNNKTIFHAPLILQMTNFYNSALIKIIKYTNEITNYYLTETYLR